MAVMSIGCSHLLLSVKTLIYPDSDLEEGNHLVRGIPAALALSRIGHGHWNGVTTFVDVSTGDDEAMAKVVTTRLGVWEDMSFPTNEGQSMDESVFADMESMAPDGKQAIVYANRKKSLTEETIKEEDDEYMRDGSDKGGLDDSWSRQSTTVHDHEEEISQVFIPPVPNLPYLSQKT